MRRARRILTEHDRAIWAQFTAEIAPLPGRPALAVPTQTAAAPTGPTAMLTAAPRPVSTPDSAPAEPVRAVSVGAAPPGLDRASWRRFETGRTAAERRIDLHGHTVQHAYHRFEHAVMAASAQGLRCIEVITGRGAGEQGGILRRELPLWINLPHLRPLILAASHPHPANPGSVRLLLRKSEVRKFKPASPSGRSG